MRRSMPCFVVGGLMVLLSVSMGGAIGFTVAGLIIIGIGLELLR